MGVVSRRKKTAKKQSRLSRLHNHLLVHSETYKFWDGLPTSYHWHWGFFIVFVLGLASGFSLQLATPAYISQAATFTYTEDFLPQPTKTQGKQQQIGIQQMKGLN